MYPASEEFKKAVYQINPSERVLIQMLTFSTLDKDLWLHSEDLVASNIKFTETFNANEELTIGSCSASTLEFKILNNHGLLSDFPFAGVNYCRALLGVCTSSDPVMEEMPYAMLRYGMDNTIIFKGNMTEPYLTVNGSPTTEQPPFPVHSIVIDGNRVYCISESGEVWGAIWEDGETWDTVSPYKWNELANTKWDDIQGHFTHFFVGDVHPFMRAKFVKWAAAKRGVWHNDLFAYEFGETIDKYEYIPLGIFVVNEPKKQNTPQILFTATDRMTKFDVSATNFLQTINYPATLLEILEGLCSYVGVSLATTSFYNRSRNFQKSPFESKEMTCREVLQWIAEASCSLGRMTRDGELELAWFGNENVNIPMEQYFNIDIASHEVNQIDKLQILSAENTVGVIIGSGRNGYQISGNPFLLGSSDDDVRAAATPIYNRLAAYQAFNPITARAVCDWSIQAGDIIRITLDGTSYRLPIYRQVITWNGGAARVTYESTGAALRPVASATQRESIYIAYAMHGLTTSTDGINSRISNIEGNVSNLVSTTDSMTTRIGDAEGNIQSLEYITQEISERIRNTERDVANLSLSTENLTTRTEGLDLAIANNKLTFDSNGLHIYGAGFELTNDSNQKVLGIGLDGNVDVIGRLTSLGEIQDTVNNIAYDIKMKIEDGALHVYLGDQIIGSLAINDSGNLWMHVHGTSTKALMREPVEGTGNSYSIFQDPYVLGYGTAYSTPSVIDFDSNISLSHAPSCIFVQPLNSFAGLKVSNITQTGFTVETDDSSNTDGVPFNYMFFIAG